MKKISITILLVLLCGCIPSLPGYRDSGPLSPQERDGMNLLKLADDKLEKGELSEAANAYNALLRQTPSGDLAAQARLGLAMVEMKQGNPGNAVSLLSLACQELKTPPLRRARASLELLDLLIIDRRYQPAAIYGRLLLESSSGFLASDERLQVLEYELTALSALGQLDQAIEMLDKALKAEINPTALWLDKFSRTAAVTYPEAAPALLNRWADRSGQAMIQLTWAQYYLNNGSLEPARKVCSELAAMAGLPPVWNELIKIMQNNLLRAEQETGVKGRIGLIMPLTGNMAESGKSLTMAVEMGLGVITGENGIELYIEDDHNDPETAASAVDRLVNEKQVLAIIGPMSLKTSQAAAAQAQALGVPMISLSQGSFLSETGDGYQFIFQNYFSPEDQIQALTSALLANPNLLRMAILAPNNNLGQRFTSLMKTAIEERGRSIAAIRYYDRNTTDFVSLARELRDSYKFDALFIPDNAERASLIVNAIHEAGIGTAIAGIHLWHSGKFIFNVGSAGQGIIFPDVYITPTEAGGMMDIFLNDFKQAAGRAPNMLEAQGYDSGLLLRHVLNNNLSNNRRAIADSLHAIKNFPGLCGMLTIQENGKISKPLTVFTINNGRFVPFYHGQEHF
jgi:ABC-type branched-subunit amino acid transport system substrate-binding protein